MDELLSQLPPYAKYVAMTLVPWIELRGAVPWAVQQGDQAFLPLILVTNWLIFFPTYFFLEWFYEHIPEGSWLHRKLERVREKARPRIERFGVLGLALFVAVPLPGTGAYSGTVAAWMLGMGWKKALLGVVVGVTLAFGAVWAMSEAAVAGLTLL
ncbi:MAG: small multi-drug export protein [Coriobacteriia bacterium]